MSDHNTITFTARDMTGRSETFSVPRILGGITLHEKIGEGGMGVVYRGFDERLKRNVAVKFLAASDRDPSAIETFFLGAGAAVAVRHPSLVQIFHADVFEGIPFLVMELVAGPSLSEVLAQTGPLDALLCVAILEGVCAAVGQLHQAGIIHRDLKPANILFGDDGRGRVTDFGISRQTAPGVLRKSTGAIAGTPSFMAPEMFAGDISTRTDVYALAMTAYQMLCSKAPEPAQLVPAPSDPEQADRATGANLTSVLESHGVDLRIIEVLQRAAHPQPLYRTKDATRFWTALRAAVGDSTVLPDPARELARLMQDRGAEAKSPNDEGSSYFDYLSTAADERRESKGDVHPSPESRPPVATNDDAIGNPSGAPAAHIKRILSGDGVKRVLNNDWEWFWFRRLPETQRLNDLTGQRQVYQRVVERKFGRTRGSVFWLIIPAAATATCIPFAAVFINRAFLAMFPSVATLPPHTYGWISAALLLATWLAVVARIWFKPMRRTVREELHRFGQPTCTGCGYDCRGLELPRLCPECGLLVPAVGK